MRIIEPMLVAHTGDTNLAASTTVELDWGLSDRQAVMIYAAEMSLSVRPVSVSLWWAGIAADPNFVAVEFDTGASWALQSALLVSGFVARAVASAVGLDNAMARFVSRYPEGYLTTRNLVAAFLEVIAGSDLAYSMDVHYKRVELTEDEQLAMIAVRNR